MDEINSTPFLQIKQKLNDLEILKEPDELSFEYSKNERYYSYTGYVPRKEFAVDYNKEVFKKLQLDQATLLTPDEKLALNLYKTQMYRAFNRIIRYQRETGIDYDENIQRYIDSSWEELRKQNEDHFNSISRQQDNWIARTSPQKSELMVADKYLDQYPNGLPSKEQYKELIVKYLPYVMSALNKVILTEDIVVYRGTSGNKELTDCALLSTSLDREKAKEFIEAREKENDSHGNLYKIIIPKGSPVIAYTTELILGKMGNHPIRDEQREILIDPYLYDFESIGLSYEMNEKKPIYFQTYIARPKVFDLEDAKQK